MRLESALFSSREGLNAHGQAIAVIGDNIANSSTTAFKTSRVEFSDLLAEGSSGHESTTDGNLGAGVTVSNVRQIQETGVIEFTGRALDVGIAGQGFFMVGTAADPKYTRAGNFAISEDGLLTTADGENVLGFTGTDTTLSTLDVKNLNVQGSITTSASIYGNLDASAAVTTVPTAPASFNELGKLASFSTSDFHTYDSLGQGHNVNVYFFKTASNQWTAQSYIDGGEVGGTKGVPVQVGANASVSFSPSGVIDTANAANALLTGAPAYSNGAAAGNFTIDLSKFTQFSGSSQLSSVTQNGQGAGNITSYEYGDDGKVFAKLDSGSSVLVGTIPLATFTNVDGLDRAGNGLYTAGDAVGTKTVNAPGQAGLGKLQGASLERSTVDIANEFVNLVVFQRGYQANSQALSTASTIIHDTIQLMR